MAQKVQIDATLADNLPDTHSFLLGTASPPRILHCVDHPSPPRGLSPAVWAAEVARSLRNLCVGNLDVLGLFVAPGANQTPGAAIESAAAAARRACPRRALVLSVAARGRPVLKDVSDAAEVRPADLRTVTGLLDSLVIVRAVVSLPTVLRDVKQPATAKRDDAAKAATDTERGCVNELVALVRRVAVCVPGDKPVSIIDATDERALADLLAWPVDTPAKKKGSGKTATRSQPVAPLDLDVHFPVGHPYGEEGDGDDDDDVMTEAGGQEEEEEQEEEDAIRPKTPPKRHPAAVEFSGTVCVRAVVTRQSDTGELLRAVRDDLTRTLRTRLDMLAADDTERKEDDEPESTPGARTFPARVIATPSAGAKLGVPLSEYVMGDETIAEDVVERFMEVLSFEPADLDMFAMERVEELATVTPSSLDAKNETRTLQSGEEDEVAPMQSLEREADLPEQLLTMGVSLAVFLTFLAIVVKQFL